MNRLTKSDLTLSRISFAKASTGQSGKARFAKSVSYLFLLFERLAFDCRRVPIQSYLLAATDSAALDTISKDLQYGGSSDLLKVAAGREAPKQDMNAAFTTGSGPSFFCQCMMPLSEGGSGRSQAGESQKVADCNDEAPCEYHLGQRWLNGSCSRELLSHASGPLLPRYLRFPPSHVSRVLTCL